MIRNIVFDMGQVLLRYDPMLPCRRHADTPEQAQTLLDTVFNAPEWADRMDRGTMSHADFVALVQSRLQTPQLRQMAAALLEDWILDALYPIGGMEELARTLHAADYKLYVLSNMSLRFREIEYKLPAYELFSGALVSAEELLVKPDEAIFHRLCEKFGLKASECLFVDDNPQNIESAKRVGMMGYCIEDWDVERLAAYLEGALDVKL